MAQDIYEESLEYHRADPPGKLCIQPTKKLSNQHDLALAYSPGVAASCRAIAENADAADLYTARGNLVAVISNGTAVLGLGAIGPLPSKPVMEGKAVLFKKFAGVDVFDIEVEELDPHKLVDIVASLEPTFGGINLEDIKAPECFIIESELRKRMKIPVFHDDQHGTAICVAAAIYNGMRLLNKDLAHVKLVASGAGAAALASLDLLVRMGLSKENVIVTDIAGVVYKGRVEEMDEYKARYAIDTDGRTLGDVIEGADVFLGLSAPNVLKPEMVKLMAENPMIMALANPVPEIMPDIAREARPDAIIATGRSDFPNQVNNVLCFPFLFRGALDVGATVINDEMKVAAAIAIAELAQAEQSDVVAEAYGDHSLSFGRDYILPKPFDPRLILEVAPAVAKAAMASGVARRPIEDFDAYHTRLSQFVYQSGQAMQPVFAEAKREPKRVVYAEGEDDRVLRAVHVVLAEGLAEPILIGRPTVIEEKIQKMGLSITLGKDVYVIDPTDNPRVQEYADVYYKLTARRGTSPQIALDVVSTRTTTLAALMVVMNEADAMLCGTFGSYHRHLNNLKQVIEVKDDVHDCSALTLLVSPKGSLFITDTHVTFEPDVEHIVEMAIQGASHVRRFGLKPRVALLSHSNFGTSDSNSSLKMRNASAILRDIAPDLMVDGEMRAETALSAVVRDRTFPDSSLEGSANLLVMPNIDAANISFTLAKSLTDGLSVGPILMGMSKPVHIVTTSITVRGLVNMTAMAVVDVHHHEKEAEALKEMMQQ